MNDESDRIEQGVLVAVIAIAVLVCSALSVRAEGFSVSVESKPLFHVATENVWLPPPPEEKAPAKKPMTFYTFDGCVPCGPVKDDIKAKKFPFPVHEFDVTQKQAPDTVTTVPAFRWEGADGVMYVYPPPKLADDKRGYVGAAELIRMWEETQRPPKQRKKTPVAMPAPIQLTPQQQALVNKYLKAGYSRLRPMRGGTD